MSIAAWICGIIAIGLFLYWQLVIAEGTYFGQGVVTYLYDLTAPRYDSIKQFDREIEAIFVGRPIADALRKIDNPLILDIATGTGRVPRALLDQPSFDGHVVGLDASWEMLEIAHMHLRRAEHIVDLVCRDSTNLPFPDGGFDLVSCIEMLEFTRSPQRQLIQAYRVLRPGGVLLTTRRRGFDALLLPGRTQTPNGFRMLLQNIGFTSVDIGRWQVDYDLVWAAKGPAAMRHESTKEMVLLCDSCAHEMRKVATTQFHCNFCEDIITVRDGIVDYRLKRRP